jgi:hypothetical protein
MEKLKNKEPSKTQHFRKINETAKRNERLREFSLELFKEGTR